jgi:hypothetical protein
MYLAADRTVVGQSGIPVVGDVPFSLNSRPVDPITVAVTSEVTPRTGQHWSVTEVVVDLLPYNAASDPAFNGPAFAETFQLYAVRRSLGTMATRDTNEPWGLKIGVRLDQHIIGWSETYDPSSYSESGAPVDDARAAWNPVTFTFMPSSPLHVDQRSRISTVVRFGGIVLTPDGYYGDFYLTGRVTNLVVIGDRIGR